MKTLGQIKEHAKSGVDEVSFFSTVTSDRLEFDGLGIKCKWD